MDMALTTLRTDRALRLLCLVTSGGTLLGCSADTVPMGATIQKTVVGPSGGQVVSPNGALVLSVAAGVLSSPTEITLSEDTSTKVDGLLGALYQIGPSGLAFSAQVTITVPEARQNNRLSIGAVSGSTARRLQTSEVNRADGSVSATIPGAGAYGVFLPTVVAHADGGTPGQGSCEADGGFPFNHSRVVPCGIPELEPNDGFESAQLIVSGIDQGADVLATFDGNNDVYRFTVPDGTWASILAVTFTEVDNYGSCAANLDLGLTLFDARGTQMLQDRTGGCSAINYYVEANAAGLWPGDWYIRVAGPPPGSSPQTYHLALFVLGPENAPYSADGGIDPRDSGY
ncbi:MAG: hypothetical protein IT384_09210 [Deltaproteobacteria bacterium]|nr:hypothetical protein [Deltaproteobacteria bacterium]